MLRSDAMEGRLLMKLSPFLRPGVAISIAPGDLLQLFVDTACRRLGTKVRRESRRPFFFSFIRTPFLSFSLLLFLFEEV